MSVTRPNQGGGAVDPQTAVNTADLLNITGQVVGKAVTFAALPTIDANGDPVTEGDMAALEVDDGVNLAGFYRYNETGGVYEFFLPLGSNEAGTVTTATADLITTNGVKIITGDLYTEFPDGTTWATPSVAEYNEYIHNIEDLHLVLAHEGAGGTTLTINKNGVPVTYDTLTNATDQGAGLIQFSGGVNQNFNRRASTIESLREVGDYFEIIKPTTGQFDSQFIKVTSAPTSLANTGGDERYRLFFNATTHTLFDKAGVSVSTGGSENATYRITRTLAGFAFTRNGVELHCTQIDEIVDYSSEAGGPATFIPPLTDVTVAPDYEVFSTIPVSNTPNTQIDTGVDLNTVDKLVFSLLRVGQQHVTATLNLNDFVFDSDTGALAHWWDATGLRVRINTADKAAGTIFVSSLNVALDLQRIEFLARASEAEALFEVTNVALAGDVTTGAFQNLGDPDARITGEDGAVVHIQYGDGNRDSFTFLDGIAKAERKGFGTSDIELQVSPAEQLQIRDLAGSSGINRAWYQLPIKLIGTGAASTPLADIDAIADFAATLKTDFLTLADGRPYTVLEDNSTQVVSTERVFNSLDTPFVEIEVLRDGTATHGPMLRANATGGRQAQLRFNLTDGSSAVANSGTDTSLPILHQTIIEEETIKYLVEFIDPVAHTELEISPAAHDAALVPSVAATGSTGVLGVRLFDSNPLPTNSVSDQSASGYIDIGNTRMVRGTNVAGVVTFAVPFASPPIITFGTSTTDGTPRVATTTAITTTGFTFINEVSGSGVASALSVGWQAIGVKP